MEPILSDVWLDTSDPIVVVDEASVAVVRERVRHEGAGLGLPAEIVGALVNVASELGHNQLAHARSGEIGVRPIRRGGTPGIEIVAADGGPGIAAPTEAVRGTPRDAPREGTAARASLGIGLSAVLELSDEVDVDTRVGEGTCVWARKFAQPVARRRQVGIYGRPCPGETVSGDDGGFVRTDDDLLIGIADGLGHGPPAREASRPAIATLRAGTLWAVDRILTECHDALHETRGVVMAAARIRESNEAVDVACIGNVSVHVYGPGKARRASGPSFILGARGRRPKVVVEEQSLASRDVLVLFTDGLSSHVDLDGELDLLREHPIVIAHQLVERFQRDNDDVLVLVAR
jgi:anti-sigma regulatory factor (Ser/Thr protein kinase)